jgi:hypothetical protein
MITNWPKIWKEFDRTVALFDEHTAALQWVGRSPIAQGNIFRAVLTKNCVFRLKPLFNKKFSEKLSRAYCKWYRERNDKPVGPHWWEQAQWIQKWVDTYVEGHLS